MPLIIISSGRVHQPIKPKEALMAHESTNQEIDNPLNLKEHSK